jgi:hypothetical protein
METMLRVLDILIIPIAILCCWYAYRIWRLNRYPGMLWLTIAFIYATILRIIIIFDKHDVPIAAMIVFWAVLLYAKRDIYKQTKKVLGEGEVDG